MTFEPAPPAECNNRLCHYGQGVKKEKTKQNRFLSCVPSSVLTGVSDRLSASLSQSLCFGEPQHTQEVCVTVRMMHNVQGLKRNWIKFICVFMCVSVHVLSVSNRWETLAAPLWNSLGNK